MQLPNVGDVFLHARLVNVYNKLPIVCEVTKIEYGCIFYGRQNGRPHSDYIEIENWPYVCKQVLPNERT